MPGATAPDLRLLGLGLRRGRRFREAREYEGPLNVYGYSKFLFDQVCAAGWRGASAQVVGFRYFNVYGPREAHKGRMASVAFHFFNQYLPDGRVRLFEGSDGYGPGEQMRDFVSVEDVVAVNLFFLDHPEVSGIFNVGTGRAQSFNDVACATVNAMRASRGEPPLSLAELRRRARSSTSPSRRSWWASTRATRRPTSARCAPRVRRAVPERRGRRGRYVPPASRRSGPDERGAVARDRAGGRLVRGRRPPRTAGGLRGACPRPIAAVALRNPDFEAPARAGRDCPPAWCCSMHDDVTSFQFSPATDSGARGKHLMDPHVVREPWAMVTQSVPIAEVKGSECA